MRNIEKYIDDVADVIVDTCGDYGDYVCQYVYQNVFSEDCHRPCRPECPFFSADRFVKWAMSEVVD